MVLFSEHMLKSLCAMRFICLKYIHAGSFFCKKIFLIFLLNVDMRVSLRFLQN